MRVYGLFVFGVILLGLGYELMYSYDDQFNRVDLFLLSDRKIYPSSYFYYSAESITYIGFAVMLFRSIIPQAKQYVLLFIILESIDLIDFWITNNDMWFQYRAWPITFNVIKVAIFMIAIIANETNRSITSNLGN